jgi:AbrB family transcriptional regulator, transcriptional pleiotropic regulator of transition state genes
MKSTGIVRKVDELGRVVIPMELRKILGMGERAPLEVFTEGNTIILRKYAPGCVICGSMDDTKSYKEKLICKSCREACK